MFDTKRFMKETFEPRTADVDMSELKDYFDEGENAVFTVRCLEGIEIGRAKEAAARNRNIRAILEGIVSQRSDDVKESIRKLIGVDDDVPQDIAEKAEYVVTGLADPPDWKLDNVLWLCRYFPVNFYALSQKILELTGLGHVPGKRKPSGIAAT
ncbi:MAG TPA: hypothetical protein ENN35_00410 [Deltaproteobacteria bacterium]|nr:hypothetical protein [Deltaproteobacteria bacterium]